MPSGVVRMVGDGALSTTVLAGGNVSYTRCIATPTGAFGSWAAYRDATGSG